MRDSSTLDKFVRTEFDGMSPEQFADYVVSNPEDSNRILYYLSICSAERSRELFEGFSEHEFF